MIKYEVGQKFPHDQYLSRGELTVSILNEAFFDVFVSLNGISHDEKETWKKGKMTVSLYSDQNIPFIIFDFGNGFSFDVSIDIKKVLDDKVDDWLNSEANSINMYLVDADSGILVAMRMIGISFAENIRDICERQTYLINTEEKINNILSTTTTAEMIKNASKKQHFK